MSRSRFLNAKEKCLKIQALFLMMTETAEIDKDVHEEHAGFIKSLIKKKAGDFFA